MYGHPVAGKLSNALLKKTIESDGYYEDDLVPCLFHHKERDTKFTLIVDDIGAEVNSEDDITHLANSIGKIWKVKIDKTGSKFIGMNLNWEYDHLPLPRMTADNPTAIPDALKRFKPGITLTGKNTPAIYNSKLYKPKNSKSKILNENNNLNLPTPVPDMKEYIQQLTGTFSHYARTIDYTMIPAVNTLSRSQAKPTTQTLLEADQLLEYASRHPNNKLIFEASDMQLKCQYDASLHTLIDGRSVIGDIKYLGNYNDPPEKVQNVFDASSTVLNAVAAHIVEAEYGSAFHCGQQAYFYGIVLEALGFTQRYIEFYGDNNIAVGISNDSVKVKRAKAIEKSYHWFRDKCRRKEFKSMHIKGLYNTSDFMTKPLPKARHNLLAPNLVSVTNMKGN